MDQDIRQLSHDWFEQVWNQRDASAIDRMLAPEAVMHGLGDDRQPGPGPVIFREFHRRFLLAFPDLHVEVVQVLVEGDHSAIRIRFGGTHLGDGLDVPPTGRSFESTGLAFGRWREGRLVEAWNEFDGEGMMRQLQAPEAKVRA